MVKTIQFKLIGFIFSRQTHKEKSVAAVEKVIK